jgi:hypothetical protein
VDTGKGALRLIATTLVSLSLLWSARARADCSDPLNPCTITTIQQLDDIGVDPSMPLSGDYELSNNIDASGFDFSPIGSSPDPFVGVLNGAGYAIENLSINPIINGGFGYGGLIGVNEGIVENIGIINEAVNTTNSVSAGVWNLVGGLAGVNETVQDSTGAIINPGKISNSYTTGSVSGALDARVGGLVGANTGLISSSFSTASVATGNNNEPGSDLGSAGGLVGSNFNGLVKNSYALGNVSGGANSNVGGLVGSQAGTVGTSFAAGTVTGGDNSNVGGLVGAGVGLSYSYASGSVSGGTGSLVGELGGNGNLDAPYDTLGSATAVTPTELQSGTLPTGFDPTVWSATAGQYPTLIAVGGQQLSLDPGTLPSAEAVNLPTSSLPSPTNIFGTLQPFLNQSGTILPPNVQSYLDTGVLASTPMPATNPKEYAANFVSNATSFTAALDLGTFIFQPDPGGAITLAVDAFGVSPLPANSSPEAETASYLEIFGSLGLTAATCIGTGGIGCAVAVIGAIAADWMIPNSQILAESDPADPNYQTVYIPPSTAPLIQVNTSDVAFNGEINATAAALEQAGAYLMSLNISINRYSSAYTAGDTSSAILQLEAILHYLSLYQSTLQNAHADLLAVNSLPELQSVFETAFNFNGFLAFQAELAQNGFTPDELTFFQDLGLSNSDINSLLQSILNLDPTQIPNVDDSIGEDFQALDTALQPPSTPIPEPPTFSIFGALVVLLICVTRPLLSHLHSRRPQIETGTAAAMPTPRIITASTP